MKTRLLACVLAMVMLLMPAADLLAWNSPGHMTVALIAYRQLSDAQKQQIAELLKHHPHYEKYLIANVPEGVNKDEWAFITAATWPDWVKKSAVGDTPKDPAITKYDHYSWHYVTINYVPAPDKKHPDRVGFVPQLPERKEGDSDVVTELGNSLKKLSAADASPEDKAVALAWVLHLTGDIHQPLHTITMFSPQYPKGDKGGNDQSIRSNGKVMPLHTFWDDLLAPYDYKTEAPIDYKVLSFLARYIMTDPRNNPERLGELKANTTPAAWAQESHELGIGFAYINGILESVPTPAVRAKQVDTGDVPPLPPGYEANARALGEQRAALAGYRLANELTTIFKP